jgi:hypothetical protein
MDARFGLACLTNKMNSPLWLYQLLDPKSKATISKNGYRKNSNQENGKMKKSEKMNKMEKMEKEINEEIKRNVKNRK